MRTDIPIPILVILTMFGALGLGVVVVLYGTILRNRWGINLEPVSCPRCGTLPPHTREPRTVRQAMWGGWTCTTCGTEVDKWGQEIASVAPRRSAKAKEQTHISLKKKLVIISAAIYFCLTLFFDWMRPTSGGLPSTWDGILFQAGAAILETALFTALLYIALVHLARKVRNSTRGRESNQNLGQ